MTENRGDLDCLHGNLAWDLSAKINRVHFIGKRNCAGLKLVSLDVCTGATPRSVPALALSDHAKPIKTHLTTYLGRD